MIWADWAIIAIVGVSALISVVRGFVREALSLVVWVAALFVAMTFYPQVTQWLTNLIETPSLRQAAAWLGLFVLTLIVGGIVNYLISQLVRATGLTGTDRFLGMLFGTARGLLVVLVILILLPQALPVTQDAWWHESVLIPYFLKFEGWARTAGAAIYEWAGGFF
ncbi:CvpA family protein [Porticoccaceae bacterium LTM1]|nr:CvpA family protein [Porticoccaceae bacterium LTM1]